MCRTSGTTGTRIELNNKKRPIMGAFFHFKTAPSAAARRRCCTGPAAVQGSGQCGRVYLLRALPFQQYSQARLMTASE